MATDALSSSSCAAAPALLWEDNPLAAAITTATSTDDLGGSAAAAAAAAAIGNSSVRQVIVHPLVLLHVLDHHSRRPDAAGRVIGTLLGRRDGSTVEITNAFSVPHAERGDEVAIGKDFNKTMLALQMRCNRKETVVGWYATAATTAAASAASVAAPLITDTSSLIHDFYAAECEDGEAVHLLVDTRCLPTNNPGLTIRAYKSAPILLQGEALGNVFHELRLSLRSHEPEAICMREMIQASLPERNPDLIAAATAIAAADKSAPAGTDPLHISMERLHILLATALEYVNAVVDGKVAPDATMGRHIADALATVPSIRPEVLDRLFHDSLQDLLMVTYLSNITSTQLTVSEKLNASLDVP